MTPTARKAWPPWWPAGLAWALWALTLAGRAGRRLLGLAMLVDLGVNGYVRYGVVVRPGSLPGARAT